MLALSGYSIWYWAILHAGKDVENRKWPTAIRGTIALHASKRIPPEDYWEARGYIERIAKLKVGSSEDFVKGAIIGVVDIVDCVKHSSSPWFFGPYGFVLQNPRVLPRPIPCAGALYFWKVPAEIEARIKDQLGDSE